MIDFSGGPSCRYGKGGLAGRRRGSTAMVMFDVSLVAALGALALFGRWFLARRPSGHAFPAISIGSCAVVAVVASLPVVVRAHLDSQLGHAASKLIGIDVRVNCQTLTGSTLDMGRELGWV
ncbi:MAG TPA: hypothetical protein VN738_11835, partial [Acidothermaceae bacterium]|nr:hypothetical protein [Acidothermaceae bacterium]